MWSVFCFKRDRVGIWVPQIQGLGWEHTWMLQGHFCVAVSRELHSLRKAGLWEQRCRLWAEPQSREIIDQCGKRVCFVDCLKVMCLID